MDEGLRVESESVIPTIFRQSWLLYNPLPIVDSIDYSIALTVTDFDGLAVMVMVSVVT